MRQTFEDRADRSFGSRHMPLIRAQLQAQGLDGFLIPHEDEHQNEYLPEANERLAWATGFTGSAGAAVVLTDRAAVFVDGRYRLQAMAQVDASLFETCDLEDGGVALYLAQALQRGQVIGYDPRLHSADAVSLLRQAAGKAGATLRPVQANPVDRAWAPTRPPQPRAPIVSHSLAYAGEASALKRARIAAQVASAGAEAALLTAPASLAWLFNIRGGDVIRSPLPLGQAILHVDGTARLFLNPVKVSDALRAWLGGQVSVEPEAALADALNGLKDVAVLVDPAQTSAWFFDILEAAGATVLPGADPTTLPRACKNPVEIEGARRAHRRDAVALAGFLHWLATDGQDNPPDEVEVVSRLEAFREATGALQDLSFDSLVGGGPNAAIVHYRPTISTNRRVEPGELLLVDSGAQYLDGTTDVTRTVAIGEPSREMRERFTLVLKGHIALATARFPVGTTGPALDTLARTPLWMRGLDYDHGTGHGVGSYLGVHEGPHRIAKGQNAVALQPGMIISNEPGYYKQDEYGIRIENLVTVTAAEPVCGGERPMLAFETLTLAPIDRRLIVAQMLTSDERRWLDAYHARVSQTVGPLVEAPVREWLERACAPLGDNSCGGERR